MPDTGTTSGLPVTTHALGVSKYMAHTRVLHVERGFHMSKNYAEQVMRDHCTITWDIPGQTIRDTTDEERIELRTEQAQRAKRMEPLALAEIHGLKFERPKTTKYRAPREAYDDMEEPSVIRVCRWPRAAHDFMRTASVA